MIKLGERGFTVYNTAMWQKAKNVYHLFTSFIFNLLYGFPSRKLVVIGVTGTSGKTTTTHMIFEILRENGFKTSMLSTIEAVIGGVQLETGFHVTTPDPHILPKYLKQAVDRGDTHFVIEISSHALDQNRAAFIKFKAGVLTTLAHEHLDYHKTFENYAGAKFKLLKNSEIAIMPISAVYQLERLGLLKSLRKYQTFGLAKGDITQSDWELRVGMPGEFNVQNGLAAAALANALGIEKKGIKKALAIVSQIPGRYEEIKSGKKFRIIIDFAHKPDALEALLNSVKAEKPKGRIITMFGAASERDVLKRPMMGEISARLSDITVLTDEDPRFENSEKIIDEIAEGCVQSGARELRLENGDLRIKKGEHVYFKIPNRKEAIEFILKKLAKEGDVILLCGKGHERSMNYKGEERPWNEQDVVEGFLQK